MRYLHPHERKIVHRRVWLGETLDQVGEAVGLSKERVRQVQKRAYKRLADHLPA